MAKTTAKIGDIVRLFTPNEYKFIGLVSYIKVTSVENGRYYGRPTNAKGKYLHRSSLIVCIPGVKKWTDVISENDI
jgi:hypothetical protein